jgi:hypothetical protein
MNPGTIRTAALVLLPMAMACGGAQTPADAPAGGGGSGATASASATAGSGGGATAGTAGATAGGGSTAAGGTGGSGPAAGTPAATATAAAAAPAEKPFAHNAQEAQNLIQATIDEHLKTLWKCVADWRGRVKDAHRALAVDIGIDQEGVLLGVVSPNPKKNPIDDPLKACLDGSLRGLPFPRSHAGVITVRQTFSDTVVQQ